MPRRHSGNSSPPLSPWPLVLALAVTQIISWGAIFYAFSVLLGPIEREMHWSRDAIVGAFSLSVLVTGLGAAPVGMLIDRAGGRVVMSLGSVLSALTLAYMSQTQSLVTFYAAWIALGVAAAMLLYEPAFAVIYQTFASNARTAITGLTLLAGFSSTIFWPLTHTLVVGLGWRDTLLVMAALNALVCLPLHALALPRKRADRRHERALHTTPETPSSSKRRLGAIVRTRSFWLLAFAFTGNILAFACLSVHLIPLLQEKGFSADGAVWLAALVGPMQVSGRLMEFTAGRRVSPTKGAIIALAVLPIGLFALLIVAQSMWLLGVVFVALYGASNGVMTIVRATIPAELFGRKHYGAVNGALAGFVIVTRAAAPLVASVLWTRWGGYDGILWLLALASLLAAVLFHFALKLHPPTAE